MIDLHAAVRGIIPVLHPDEAITLYRSTGQHNVYGEIKATYAEPESLQAQIQSLTPEDIEHLRAVNETNISRRMYLPASPTSRPAGIVRAFERNGDMVQREDGTWWYVTKVPEDFSKSGWEAVLITMQVNPPDFSASDWREG